MASAKGTKKRVEVDGRKYTVDTARVATWTAVKMMARINAEDDDSAKGLLAIQYADYVLGDEMAKVVEACGGDDAPAESVIKLAFEILAAASKN